MYYRLKYDESEVRYVISDSDDVVMDKNAPKNLVVLKAKERYNNLSLT